MNAKEKLFSIGGVVTGIAIAYLTGCVTPVESGSSYPQYDKWWRTGMTEGNSMEYGPGNGTGYRHAIGWREQVPMPVRAPKLDVDFPEFGYIPNDRPREWDQKWDLTPEELRIGPPVSIGHGSVYRHSFPVEAHTDSFGVVTFTQLL